MGFSNIGIFQLIIVLLLVILLFGTKRLQNLGPDLGRAIRGFRSSVREAERKDQDDDADETAEQIGQAPRNDSTDKQAKTADGDADFDKPGTPSDDRPSHDQKGQ